jgi:bifunctional DNase/RNase
MTFQLAANLVAAGGARIAEVRITRLAETTFYVVVFLETPQGLQQVDARPSDALNLAALVGAPITVDTNLLADPQATDDDDWRDYPFATHDIVTDLQERQAKGFR